MSCTSTEKDKYKDLVPDEATAVKIAESTWNLLYGAQKIASEKPFKAELLDSVWHVTGTSFSKIEYEYIDGKKLWKSLWYTNAAYIYINKRDAKILKVGHGK